MRYVLILTLLILTPMAVALEPYYGAPMALDEPKASDPTIKLKLFTILSGTHVEIANYPDQILNHCPPGKICRRHQALGYTMARQKLFGTLFLFAQENQYALPDFYCGQTLTAADFPTGKGPGPDRIPDPTIINAEHAWPQSRFSRQFPNDLQKSDLHILFPVSSRTNSLRSNFPFGDVVTLLSQTCPASRLGYLADGRPQKYFLPPADQRGNLARALFYFAVRYQLNLDSTQETTLRHWHHLDPVDSSERARHEQIHIWQSDRNPFVDHPEWVELVPDF